MRLHRKPISIMSSPTTSTTPTSICSMLIRWVEVEPIVGRVVSLAVLDMELTTLFGRVVSIISTTVPTMLKPDREVTTFRVMILAMRPIPAIMKLFGDRVITRLRLRTHRREHPGRSMRVSTILRSRNVTCE